MRFVSLCAFLATTTALSGCVGGDGSALSLANRSVDVCGVNDPTCATASTGSGSGSGGGTGGGTGTTPPPNTGNTANIVTGDATIALEKDVVVSTKTTPSLSNLTLVSGSSGNPNTAKISIDTNTANNGLWPIAKTMDEYTPGTFANGSNGALPPAGLGLGGSVLGGSYREYRAYSKNASGTAIDEELQVWSFANSYATQYRDVTATGGSADHQAWSFGGTKTPAAAMTLRGSGHYVGKFGATAKTSNYINRDVANGNGDIQTIDNNNKWRVWGDSDLNANFLTGTFTGTLTPREWNAFKTMHSAAGFETVDAAYDPNPNTFDPNWAGFMDDNVILKGSITSTATGNSIKGTAVMDPNDGWLSNTDSNAMYAGAFGANAEEITGAFAVEATDPSPMGGYFPINDDRRGYITMSGVFNGVAQ